MAESRGGVARRPALSAQMQDLAKRIGSRAVKIGELHFAFGGRSIYLMLILLSLPFMTPVPLPLLSAPFGLLITAFGLSLALRRKPWVPERIANTEVPGGAFAKILSLTGKIVSWLERLAKPRWVYPVHMRVFRRATGSAVALAGLLLSLPLPVPFSNLLPAVAIASDA